MNEAFIRFVFESTVSWFIRYADVSLFELVVCGCLPRVSPVAQQGMLSIIHIRSDRHICLFHLYAFWLVYASRFEGSHH